jgi:hypothetical protein
MKILSGLLLIFLFNIHLVSAQQNNQTVSTVMPVYFELKNALVNSDVVTASAKAGELVNAMKSSDFKSFNGNDPAPVFDLNSKIISAAGQMANTKDISEQRQFFAALSQDLFALAKRVKLSDQAVYQMYCPMKGSYWLSAESVVRNPYYGKAMLSCGSVTESIKP